MRSNLGVIILKSLLDGDKYGWEIIKEVEEKTDGQLIIKQPSLYSSLKRMEKQKFITSYWRDSDIGGKRHYYSVTAEGKLEFEKNSFNWENSKGLVASILTTNAAQKGNETREPEFGEFDPIAARENLMQKSFSAKSREYVKPDNTYPEYTLQQTNTKKEAATSTEESVPVAEEDSTPTQDRPIPQNEYRPTLTPQPTPATPKPIDIDYKNILGDLCYENDTPPTKLETTPVTPTPRAPTPYTPTQFSSQKQPTTIKSSGGFAKQYESVLLKSTNKQATADNSTPQPRANLKEFAAKYGASYEPKDMPKAAPIKASKPVVPAEENLIAQDILNSVSIKPHQKMFDADIKSRKFININRLYLIKACVIFALFLIEIAALYFTLDATGFIKTSDHIMYILAVVLAVIYILLYLLAFTRDPNKKVKAGLNLKRMLLIRTGYMLGIIALTFCICLLCGMQDWFGVQFLSKWLLPIVLSLNILLGIAIEHSLSKVNRLRA